VSRREEDLDAELRAHLDMAIADRMARGESRDDAEAAARREFGNQMLVGEMAREQWGWSCLHHFFRDARYGVRLLWRSPTFTVVAVVALALGVGANTAIFSVVDGVLLRPLPYPDPERLVAVQPLNVAPVRAPGASSYPDFYDWRAAGTSFSGLSAYHESGVTLSGVERPAHLDGVMVTADLFDTVGAKPLFGRTFVAGEDRAGVRVTILSHDLWTSRFARDRGVVGRVVQLDGEPYTVVGVMPAGFRFPLDSSVDLWTTTSLDAEGKRPWTSNRGLHTLEVIGRLKPGSTLATARAEMTAVARALAAKYPETNRDRSETRVLPELDRLVGDVRTPLLILLGAVACVLLIACANVANLLLARATTRAHELSLRAGLGASRTRLIRQLLTESLVLAVAGGAAGLVTGLAGIRLLVRLSPSTIPRLENVGLDARVFVFAFATSLVTGVVFGVVPALRASRRDPGEALKESGRGLDEGGRPSRLRSALVIGETAVAVVLLAGAGLLIESFRRLANVPPGFDPHGVLTFRVSLPEAKFTEEGQKRFYDRLLSDLSSRKDVVAAAAVFPLPFGGGRIGTSYQIEGRPVPEEDEPGTEFRQVSAGYFRTMKIPLLQGRVFDGRDGARSTPVVIVNRTLARRSFPNENPIGRRIQPGISRGGPSVWREIVGVVADVKSTSLAGEPQAESYVPYEQLLVADMSIAVRTAGDSRSLAASLKDIVGSISSDVPLYGVRDLDRLIGGAVAQPRFNAIVLGVFAALALTLTAVGLYGVMAYAVERRTHEIGIRMALGAGRPAVLRMVVGKGLALVSIGLVIGLAGALAATRWLSGLLFQVQPSDPATFTATAVVLAAVAVAASYFPARRATHIEPMSALRYE